MGTGNKLPTVSGNEWRQSINTFTTDIDLTKERSALELLGIAGDQDRDTDDLDIEEIETVTVDVSYDPGWFTPGRFSGPPGDCYPDDGESPEILSVIYTPENGKPKCIDAASLSEEVVKALEELAWEDQDGAHPAADAAAEAAYDDYMDGLDLDLDGYF